MKKVLSLILTLIMVISITSNMPVSVSATNGMVENAINWAIGIANDNNYGYSQVNRYGNPDYDCSSLVSTAFHNAGFNVACELNTYTMKDAFVNAGFTWIPASQISGFPGSCANLQRGDILLATSHTELYIGNGKNVGAHMDYNGIPGGIGGGSTWSSGYNAYRYGADEIDVCNYWNDNWLGVLRYGDTYTEPPVAPVIHLSRNILKTNETATLYWESCDKAEYYWISCWSETEQCISEESHSLSKEISFSSPGKYSITVVSCNSKGETIGNWIDIEVYDTDGYNKVSYNANGGTGTMSSHNVYYNSVFSLKESTFKKTGYKQVGWNAYRCSDNKWFAYGIGWKTEEDINKNGWTKSVYPNPIKDWTFDWSWYNEGILNDTIIFYAVWEKVDTYKISYNANGGTGAPSSQTKTYGQTLTLSSTKPTRSGYTFLGWSTSSTATKATYSAGGSFTIDEDTTLYAVWSKNHTHSYTETITKKPTCTETGTKKFTCSCGASYTQTIPTTGHNESGWIIDKKASTANDGLKHKECTVCGAVTVSEVIPRYSIDTPKLKSVSNTTSGVKLVWKEILDHDFYIVYRKTSKSGWSRIGTTTKTTFIDKTAKSGTTYYYTVKAQSGDYTSGYDKTGLSIKCLATPTLKTVSNTSTGVKITWGKVTGTEVYKVYRKTSKSGSWQYIGKTSSTSYTDKTAKKGTSYYYTVQAYSGSVKSSYNADGLSIRRLSAPKVSSAVSNREGILVKWNKIAGASGYYVYRKAPSGDWKKIATVKGNTKVKYLDESPKKGVTYQYKVKAYYSQSTSAYSGAFKVKCKY